jgi:hypothetical protein
LPGLSENIGKLGNWATVRRAQRGNHRESQYFTYNRTLKG